MIDEKFLTVECPTCGAKIGEVCKHTISQKPLFVLIHTMRKYALIDATNADVIVRDNSTGEIK